MRLKQVFLERFRAHKTRTAVDVEDMTVLVGKNDAGKSSILDALEVFFENKPAPGIDDLSVNVDGDDIVIGCKFDSIPDSVVIDEQHPTSLSNEHLLDVDGSLTITKRYACTGKTAKLKSISLSCSHPSTEGYDDLFSLTIAKLKARAVQLGVDLAAVRETTKAPMRQAIWNHCDDLKPHPIELDVSTTETKHVYEKLKTYLPLFSLFRSDRPSTDQDAEAQDPMKAAISEAVKQHEATLQKVAEDVTTEAQKVADATVAKISEMNPELASTLSPKVSRDKLEKLFKISLTGDDQVPINKRGSGTRRLILLNFFRVQAARQSDRPNTHTIYAIEEPETSQHPDNQKMLIDALSELSDGDGSQVIMTTHTPVLARRLPDSCLRLVECDSGDATVCDCNDDAVRDRLVESLGVLPDHTVKAFLGVEGKHDISFLKEVSKLLSAADNTIANFEDEEAKGTLVFIPLGGANLEFWSFRLAQLNRPEFYLTDRDNPPGDKAKYQDAVDEWNAQPNCTAWVTGRRELENYIGVAAIKRIRASYTGVGDGLEDVPALYTAAGARKRQAKQELNGNVVRQMTLGELEDRNEVEDWLRQISAPLLSD